MFLFLKFISILLESIFYSGLVGTLQRQPKRCIPRFGGKSQIISSQARDLDNFFSEFAEKLPFSF